MVPYGGPRRMAWCAGAAVAGKDRPAGRTAVTAVTAVTPHAHTLGPSPHYQQHTTGRISPLSPRALAGETARHAHRIG